MGCVRCLSVSGRSLFLTWSGAANHTSADGTVAVVEGRRLQPWSDWLCKMLYFRCFLYLERCLVLGKHGQALEFLRGDLVLVFVILLICKG